MTTPTFPTVRWLPVPGGTCRYGDRQRPRSVADLLVTVTALTYHQVGWPAPTGQPDVPITGIDHDTAQRLAALVGGRLPTSIEWEWFAAGPDRRSYPWGDQPWTANLAQLHGPGCGHRRPGTVGRHPQGATPDGLLDVAGTVWEWTTSATLGGGFVIRGGSFASKPLYAQTTFLNAVHGERRSPGIGVRAVKPA